MNYDVLKYIDNNTVEEYVQKSLKEDYVRFYGRDEIYQKLGPFKALKADMLQDLRSYKSLGYQNIKDVVDNVKQHELEGVFTSQVEEKCFYLFDRINDLFQYSLPLKTGIVTYRDVPITYFDCYGIKRLEDLSSLENQYLYEESFISTYFIRKESSSLAILYYIPKDSDDGFVLFNDFIYHSTYPDEFLIQGFNLAKVFEVKIDKENQKAYLKALLIPEFIWNLRDYKQRKLVRSK